MSFWPMLLTIVSVAILAFWVGLRIGTVRGYDRAERMLGEIVEEQAQKRGWTKKDAAAMAIEVMAKIE